jgi:hypothetical protein
MLGAKKWVLPVLFKHFAFQTPFYSDIYWSATRGKYITNNVANENFTSFLAVLESCRFVSITVSKMH